MSEDTKKNEPVNMVFDEETLKLLHSFVGLNPLSTFKWVPKVFRQFVKDKTKWPVYTIKPLDNLDRATLEDHVGTITYTDGNPMLHPRHGEARTWLIRNNVKLANNLYNKDTNSFVNFVPDVNGLMNEDFIRFHSVEAQKEIYEAIQGTDMLTDEEKVGL